MDRGTWPAIVHGVARVGHALATKPKRYKENFGGDGYVYYLDFGDGSISV